MIHSIGIAIITYVFQSEISLIIDTAKIVSTNITTKFAGIHATNQTNMYKPFPGFVDEINDLKLI